MKLDAEMELLQAKMEAGIIKNEPDGSGARSSDAGAKHPKLPNFQDRRDDLDIWLTRLRDLRKVTAGPGRKCSSSLRALLTGRALDCDGRFSAEQAKDYDKVKEALMKRYDLAEDGYCRKFRTCKPAEDESPDIFIVRIVTYLDRWIELSKTDKSYGKVKDLIVREQFMDACPEDLATSLREKDLLTLERVAKKADLFLKARSRKLSDQSRKCFSVMLGLEWTLCGRLNQRRSLTVDNVQGRRRRAWLTRGRASSARRHGISLGRDRRDSGCEGVVVRKQLVDASQLTGECCLLLRIDNTALLAEKAVISLRTPFLSEEVKALCIPDAICGVIVGNVEGARSPENPDISVMVGAVTTRAQARCEAVTKPLRVPDIERHIEIDREQLIKFQREDPRILALVDAGRTSRRGGKVVSFERARGIVYRRYQDLGRNVDVKHVVLPKPLRECVMSVAHDSIVGAHLGIRRTKDKVLSNFYWPGVDGDVTRYCQSCDVCQRTVKKGIVPRVPLERVPLIDTPFKRVAIDLVSPINPPSEAGHRFILTLVDCATRFSEEVPLHKINTESVTEALVDVNSRLGVPEEVLSDQGRQFISDRMREVCRLLGTKQKTTTLYHPMCNGLAERFNATLKTCLRRLCSEQPRQSGYIARNQDARQTTKGEGPPTSSSAIPAASVTVIEDLEGEHFNNSDCEVLPELGGWGSEETVNDLKYGDELTLDQRRQLEEVALTYSSIVSDRPSTASTEEHCIELTSSTPVRQRQYPVPYAMRQTLRDELREMEDLGVIRKSYSHYASPVVVVKKKDGTNRVCIDYRRLNKLTIFDPQPGTPLADIFQGMEKDQYF
ncbi:gypsy retrotransposon integrase-like protein 1 [Plakobranchus ocellatus]|uniref:Gypsy retrotransposon integrase-like protein 1 n=1 Tax=Plakobranchus ocellatus TaxID=259542 RepID=A0AAV4C7X2_9GAST|nr:gypsy retrotransposon integrase-like protein 1 [Plakobranchus ocellatus]